MSVKLKILLCLILNVAVLSHSATAAYTQIKSPAQQAILIDHATGTVLFEKNSEQAMAPSSMSKLMTLYILFTHLTEGSLSLDDTFLVSKKAWQMGGSKMFVGINTQVKISDLILLRERVTV